MPEIPTPVRGSTVIVALIGLPGAGKTAVARHLVASLGLRLVCRDTVRAALFPACRYTEVEKRTAFRAALLALDVNAALALSSVFDGATLARRRDRDRIAEVAHKRGASFVPIYLQLAPELARQRVDLDRSKHLAADRDPALVDAVVSRFEPVSEDTSVIDASQALAHVLEMALYIVRRRMVA